MIIREATLKDVIAMLDMASLMQQESPKFSHNSFDAVKASGLFTTLVVKDNGIAFIAEKDGQPVGMIGGMVVEQFFSHDLYACDFGVYLKPEHRGGSAVIKMIKAFEQRAIELGAKEISLGISTEVHAERTASLYERLGYVRSGISTIKRV
jgi:RimJ/RimL family protein N-acetyltransferase